MHVFIVKRYRPDGSLETLTRNRVLACFVEEEEAQKAADSIGGFVEPHEAEVEQVDEYILVPDEELRNMQAPSVGDRRDEKT